MNAETKICLVLVTLLAIGIVMLAYGLGLTTKLAISGVGVVTVAVAAWLLAAVWKGTR